VQSADSTRPCGAQPRVVALTVGVLPEERYRWRYLAAGTGHLHQLAFDRHRNPSGAAWPVPVLQPANLAREEPTRPPLAHAPVAHSQRAGDRRRPLPACQTQDHPRPLHEGVRSAGPRGDLDQLPALPCTLGRELMNESA
jgi:hypothetical protein